MRSISVLVVVALSLLAFPCWSEDRYPPYLPKWLWQDARYGSLIDDAQKKVIESLLAESDELSAQGNDEEAEKKVEEARKLIHSSFSARDLAFGATLISETDTSRIIALHLDPTLPPVMEGVLKEAVRTFLRLATDEELITLAFAQSLEEPQPIPPQTVDGKPNDAASLFHVSQKRPVSPEAFQRQLANVLKPADSSVPVLVISAFSNSPWWGGGLYDEYNNVDFSLLGVQDQS